MASNPYLNFYTANNEQSLYEDLIVESIKFYAEDVIYLPRNKVSENIIFNEVDFYTFSNTANVEVYLKTVDKFAGQGLFFSKFAGLEIRDEINVTMSIRSFNEFVQPKMPEAYVRPMEGDLIFIPMTQACYKIAYVETAAIWYATGKLMTFDLKLELFEYSNESFNTNTAIDAIYSKYDTNVDIENDTFEQNEDIEDVANTVIDWSLSSPFGDD